MHYIPYFYKSILTENDRQLLRQNLKQIAIETSETTSDTEVVERLQRMERIEAFNLLPLWFTARLREALTLPCK